MKYKFALGTVFEVQAKSYEEACKKAEKIADSGKLSLELVEA